MKALSRPDSLRGALTRAILLTSLAMIVLAALLSAIGAFAEAREQQDEMLATIASLAVSDQLVDSGRAGEKIFARRADDETIVLRVIDATARRLEPALATLGPGWHTRLLHGRLWRLHVRSNGPDEPLVVAAQPTAVRDERALDSAFYAFATVSALLLVTLLVIDRVTRRQFRRLDALGTRLDASVGAGSARIGDAPDAPAELRPFLAAIDALLARNAEVLRRQRRFVADAAHELRTPIAALALQTANLERSGDSRERARRLRALTASVTRLQRLVAQLLDLARLRENRDEGGVQDTVVDAHEIVREVVAEAMPFAIEKGIDLGVSGSISARLVDESGALARLLRNAIDNALRHTPPGRRVDVALACDGDVAVLTVEDEGEGIAEQELDRVFEPFRRGDVASGEGTGLGLAICREIAARLGGELRLENRAEGGLRFRYAQPLSIDPE